MPQRTSTKKRNRTEANSGRQSKEKQSASTSITVPPQARGEREYGIKSVLTSGREWYIKCRPKRYHPYLAVEEHS